jgi:hypothetical protein
MIILQGHPLSVVIVRKQLRVQTQVLVQAAGPVQQGIAVARDYRVHQALTIHHGTESLPFAACLLVRQSHRL